MLPKDPNMLLSYINTGIRDKYSDFYDMADSEGFDATEVMEKLEKAGCHVIYGLVGLKTHSKITLVVRMEEDGCLFLFRKSRSMKNQ